MDRAFYVNVLAYGEGLGVAKVVASAGELATVVALSAVAVVLSTLVVKFLSAKIMDLAKAVAAAKVVALPFKALLLSAMSTFLFLSVSVFISRVLKSEGLNLDLLAVTAIVVALVAEVLGSLEVRVPTGELLSMPTKVVVLLSTEIMVLLSTKIMVLLSAKIMVLLSAKIVVLLSTKVVALCQRYGVTLVSGVMTLTFAG